MPHSSPDPEDLTMHKTHKSPKPATTITAATLRQTDLSLLIRYGKEIAANAYVMTPEVARAEIHRMRRSITAVERLGRSGIAYRLDQTIA